MIELKQLQYLMVCADLHSFSKAAEVLFTTQPNVSKVIKSLEEELGFPLFIRQNRGIVLTSRGKHVYDYACRAMENVNQLSAFARMDQGEELSISFNPSSWMAVCFTDFYKANPTDKVRFHVISASTEDIIRRCASGRDELGFVYTMEPQNLPFQYKLEKNHLEFVELKQVKAMLSFGKDNPLGKKLSVEEIPMDQVQLVQCYEDEFTLNHYWDLMRREQEHTPETKVSVITNSDYIMNELLRRTDLGNISGAYLSHEETSQHYPGVSLYGDDTPVLFGCIRRKEENLSRWAQMFLAFVKNSWNPEERAIR